MKQPEMIKSTENGEQYRRRTAAQAETRHVQAFISNISAPRTLEELWYFITEVGEYNVEELLHARETNWTVPFWAKSGDVVFFMHAKYAHTHFRALKKELAARQGDLPAQAAALMQAWIERGLRLHARCGGKIFAVARVCGMPEIAPEDEADGPFHWRSRIYADMDRVCPLASPIDVSEFGSRIQISRQSGITPVFGEEFAFLQELVLSRNPVPAFFRESVATPLPMWKINAENWLTLANAYRRSFLLEAQFRAFYVDHLLRRLSDVKTLYRECRCRKTGAPDAFVDNVILFGGRYLPVEVKLSVRCEANIAAQLEKYCRTDAIELDSRTHRTAPAGKVIAGHVLVIDTEQIFLYRAGSGRLVPFLDLDDLHDLSDADRLKTALLSALGLPEKPRFP